MDGNSKDEVEALAARVRDMSAGLDIFARYMEEHLTPRVLATERAVALIRAVLDTRGAIIDNLIERVSTLEARHRPVNAKGATL